MTKIITYREPRYCMMKLESGERIMLSIAQSGIVIYRMRCFGLIRVSKIAQWLPQELDRYVALFGGEHPTGGPFRYAVDKLASFGSIRDLRAYLMQGYDQAK